MSDLPPGWEWTTVGDIADIQLGRQRSPKNHTGAHMRPYLRSANVTWDGIDVSDVKEMNFDPSEAATFELAPGDLLLNEGSGSPNEVGKPAIWRGEIAGCCFQNTLLRVRSKGPFTPYLYWYCRAAALAGDFGEAGRGVSIRHLGKKGLASFPIALPPEPEQRRVVAAIEERLSGLDAADSWLSSALGRVRTLEKSIIIECASTRRPPTHWRQVRVDEAGVVGLGLMRSPKRHTGPNMRPYLRVANVLEDRIDDRDVMSMDFSDDEWERYRLHYGDILLNEGQSPEFLGRPAMYRGSPPGVAFTKSLLRFQAGSGIDPDWALLVFRSHMHSRRFMQESRITTNIAHLAAVRFKAVEFPVPPMDEQLARVRIARDGLDACERVRQAVLRNKRRSEQLRKAVLSAAFAGRLTPEVGDEPTEEPIEQFPVDRVDPHEAHTRKAG